MHFLAQFLCKAKFIPDDAHGAHFLAIDDTERQNAVFLLQWALNALWTPLFFGLHRPGWALADILVLLAAILATMRAFWQVDRPAALLLLPYAAWVAFASVLNSTIWRMN